jgi:hypothetical protein
LLFLLSPLPGGPEMAQPERLRRFRCRDQSRIAVTCREIRDVRTLELTLRIAEPFSRANPL